MVQPLLASSGTGYGTSSLDDDAYQLDQLAEHLLSFYNSQVLAAAQLSASRAALHKLVPLWALQQGEPLERPWHSAINNVLSPMCSALTAL